MVRTNVTDVKEILGDLATGVDDSIFTKIISDANVVITAKLGSSGLLDDQLASIEKWFAAHLAASSVCREVAKESIGTDVAVTYTGKWETELKLTSYGQMVLVLDTTGIMAKLGKLSAKFRAIPTTYD